MTIYFLLLPQICEIKPSWKLIKMTICENMSSRNQPKNHYRKLDYVKIYLLKVYSSMENLPFSTGFLPFWENFFMVLPAQIIRSRQVSWEEISMTTILQSMQLILIWLWNTNETRIMKFKVQWPLLSESAFLFLLLLFSVLRKS